MPLPVLHEASGDGALVWHADPVVLLGIALAGVGYWLAARRLRARGGRVDGRAAACWTGGLLAILVALESPLDAVAEQRSLAAHMVQHELLVSLAAPLLLLGLYPRLVVPIVRPALRRVLRGRRSHRLARVLAGPVVSLVVWLVMVTVWHVPRLYDAAVEQPQVHIVEHLSLLAAGLVLWLPVLEPVPAVAPLRPVGKLVYLAVAQAGSALVAAMLIFSPSLLYPTYADNPTILGLSRISDQRAAGGLMMVTEMVVALAVAWWVVLRMLWTQEWRERRAAVS